MFFIFRALSILIEQKIEQRVLKKMHFLKWFSFFTCSITEDLSDLDVREMLLNRLRDSFASELPKIKPSGIWSLFRKKHLISHKSEEASVMDMLRERLRHQS